MNRSTVSTRFRRARPGIAMLSTYASSMLLLGIASLIIIPEMISVEGGRAWGSIAVGQAWGAVGAIIIAYGWHVSGPALVAQGDESSRRREFVDSLVLKSLLVVPVSAASGAASMLFVSQRADLAAAGAVSTAAVGLTASWFFVGVSRPFQLLWAETVPRVLGTLVGIVAMRLGAQAMTGLMCQLGGMLAAVVISSALILAELPAERPRLKQRSPREILVRQVHGLGASVASTAYISAPVVLVSVFAPAIQPVYALVDRLQRQVGVGLTPIVSLLQGWVPGGASEDRASRIRTAMLATSSMSAVLAVVVGFSSPLLVGWVGGGHITVDTSVYVLMGAFVGLILFEASLAQAVLPTLGRLDVVAKATALSAVVGLPLTVLGALGSVELAMLGLLGGLVGRIGIELVVALRPVATTDHD